MEPAEIHGDYLILRAYCQKNNETNKLKELIVCLLASEQKLGMCIGVFSYHE